MTGEEDGERYLANSLRAWHVPGHAARADGARGLRERVRTARRSRSALPRRARQPPRPLPHRVQRRAAPARSTPGSRCPGRRRASAGYYTVKPGDTLIRIGLDNGQNWKDLVKWNGLENPNVIEVGQVLRVVPPGVDPALATTRPVSAAKIETRPLPAAAAASAATGTPTAVPRRRSHRPRHRCPLRQTAPTAVARGRRRRALGMARGRPGQGAVR